MPAVQPPAPGSLGGAGGDPLPILPGLPSSLQHCRPPCRSPRAAGEAGAGGGACSAGQAEGKGPAAAWGEPARCRAGLRGPAERREINGAAAAESGEPAVNPDPSAGRPVLLLLLLPPPLRPRPER